MSFKQPWKYFCDESYFHKWAVQHEEHRSFNQAIHVNTKEEAEFLVDQLNKLVNLDWKPMSEAPKDGTRFDVWMHDPDRPNGYRFTDCKWCSKQNTFVNSRLFRLEAMIPVDTGIPAIYPKYFKLVTSPELEV